MNFGRNFVKSLSISLTYLQRNVFEIMTVLQQNINRFSLFEKSPPPLPTFNVLHFLIEMPHPRFAFFLALPIREINIYLTRRHTCYMVSHSLCQVTFVISSIAFISLIVNNGVSWHSLVEKVLLLLVDVIIIYFFIECCWTGCGLRVLNLFSCEL